MLKDKVWTLFHFMSLAERHEVAGALSAEARGLRFRGFPNLWDTFCWSLRDGIYCFGVYIRVSPHFSRNVSNGDGFMGWAGSDDLTTSSQILI